MINHFTSSVNFNQLLYSRDPEKEPDVFLPGHDQLNYYLGFHKYATYVPKWSIDQLRPIVIQEIAAENTVGLCLEAAEIEVAE